MRKKGKSRIVVVTGTPNPGVVQCTTWAIVHSSPEWAVNLSHLACFSGSVLDLMLSSSSLGGRGSGGDGGLKEY